MGEPEKREPVPTTPLEGVRAFTEEESEAIKEKRANLGDDMVAVMRDVDSAAYKEYQNISQEGNASGTREGMVVYTAEMAFNCSCICRTLLPVEPWVRL